MKATERQYLSLAGGLDSELGKMNLNRVAVCEYRDLWVLLARWLATKEDSRPLGVGTASNWLLSGLNDSHVKTMFKKYMKEVGKVL